MLRCGVTLSLSGLRFLPVTVNQNFTSAKKRRFFHLTISLNVETNSLNTLFLASKNTQRYHVLISKKYISIKPRIYKNMEFNYVKNEY